MEFDISGGSRAHHILNTLASVTKSEDSNNDPGSAVTVNSTSVLGMTGNTVQVTVTAPIMTTGTVGGTTAFENSPQSAGDQEEVRFTATLSGGGADGSHSVVAWILSFNPNKNSSLWNDTLARSQSADMNKRSATINDYDIEWYTDSGYTNKLNGLRTFVVSPGTFPGESITYYLRSRPTGGTLWTQNGAVTWTDPREPL